MAARKVIFITGGNRGIGKGLVEHLGKDHDVYYSVRAKTGELPASGQAVTFDVLDQNSIDRAVKGLKVDFDILVNNAGVLYDYEAPALKADIDEIKKTFDINTLGPLRVSRAIVPKMKAGGRIINVSSGMGQLSDMGTGAVAYRLSKTALNALSKIMANELNAKNIAVNAICPGWVKTDMGGPNATRSVEESVAKIVKFMLREPFPTGQFLRDGESIPW